MATKELVQQGMSQAEANAQVVAEHREEVLFDLFSRFLSGMRAVVQAVRMRTMGKITWETVN